MSAYGANPPIVVLPPVGVGLGDAEAVGAPDAPEPGPQAEPLSVQPAGSSLPLTWKPKSTLAPTAIEAL